MTATDSMNTCRPSRKARYRRHSVGGLIALLLLWGFVCFALRDAALLARTVQDALSLCIRQVIPVLFPIAAAGGLLTTLAPPPRFLCRPIGRLFRLSDASVGVLLIALVSGFPIGAMLASRLLESGRIGREEASRLAAYTNNASAAFLTGCVGADFFGSPRLGWILWIASTSSALLVGRWMARHAPRPAADRGSARPLPAPGELAQALKATGQGMLNLTAFVVFFAVFCAFWKQSLTALLPSGAIADYVSAITIATFEITGGLSAIARLSAPLSLRMALSGAAAGFGGLSVFLQCMAAGGALQMESAGKRLFTARLAIGILSGILSLLFALIWC